MLVAPGMAINSLHLSLHFRAPASTRKTTRSASSSQVPCIKVIFESFKSSFKSDCLCRRLLRSLERRYAAASSIQDINSHVALIIVMLPLSLSLSLEFELQESSVSTSISNCDKISTHNGMTSAELSDSRPKLTHKHSSSLSVSSANHSEKNSISLSTDSPSQNTETVEGATLRKKGKSSRMSFPTALNSAGDKIFGKKKSSESMKVTKVVTSDSDKRKSLKDFLGFKKSSSKDRMRTLSTSHETGLEDTGLAESDSSESTKPDDSPVGQVVFKPRYTPLDERRNDCWQTATPDAPLATEESDGNPLYTDPPKRSFPLSSTSLPYRVHSDMYDTAFALTSLKGGGSVTGLQYLNKIHSVTNTAFSPSSTRDNPLSGADNPSNEGKLSVVAKPACPVDSLCFLQRSLPLSFCCLLGVIYVSRHALVYSLVGG